MGKRKRFREKNCEICQVVTDVMYRIKPDAKTDWVLACPRCQSHAANEVGYQYGGTWKANKKARR